MNRYLATILISSASADWLSMNSMFEQLIEHDNATKLAENSENNLMQQRNVRPWLKLPGLGMQDLDNWGCWCYFGSDDPNDGEYKGRGEPVDDYLDVACRDLRLAYDCMIIDEDENGEVCVPWEENYNSGLVFGLNSVEKMCSKHNNPESCAYKACTVEGSFVIKIFDFVFTEGLSIDASFSHDNGFNVDEKCTVKEPKHEHENHPDLFRGVTDFPATTPRNNRQMRMINNHVLQANHLEKQCCGEYPNRFPFKPLKGFHDCCDGKVFETRERECCTDGSLKNSGTCGQDEEHGEEMYEEVEIEGSGEWDTLALNGFGDSLQIDGY